MAYDEELADRLREAVEGAAVQGAANVSEKTMFGGLAFLINGNLAVSASSKGGLLLRVDPTETDSLVSDRYVTRAVMRGREMDGWLRIDPAALETDEDLAHWVHRGVDYARSLPPT